METVALAWNANTELDLAGYQIHWGSSSGVYTDPGSPKSVGLVVANTVDVQPTGLKFFALQAVNTSAQVSGFSNEISKNVVLPLSGGAVFRGRQVRAPVPTVRRA